MAGGGIVLDEAKYKRLMAQYGKQHKSLLSEELTKTMGFLASSLVKTMPPTKDRRAGFKRSKHGGASKKTGDKAVMAELRSHFVPLSTSEINTVKPMRGASWAGWSKVVHESGAETIANDANIMRSASTSAIKARHRPGKRGRRDTHRMGWKNLRAAHVPEASLNQFVKASKVGQLKGGWAKGSGKYGGKTPPRWISDYDSAGSATGSIKNGRGRITLRNNVSYASRHRDIVGTVLIGQKKSMMTRVKHAQKKAASAANSRQRVA
jgi:hypothetical protein